MTPTDCLASTFRPRSHDLVALALAPGIGVGGTGRPISRVSLRLAVLHRPGRPAECQGSPEHPFLKG